MDDKKKEIEALQSKLEGPNNLSMDEEFELRDRIHNLDMEIKGVKPEHQIIDCIGCGS
jgi:hypothetical protein